MSSRIDDILQEIQGRLLEDHEDPCSSHEGAECDCCVEVYNADSEKLIRELRFEIEKRENVPPDRRVQ